jgi:hypothetical protein
VRRHDPLWRAELCPVPPLNQIHLMLGCFCCACGYVGNALALSTYPQAGPALARSWLAFTGKGAETSATGPIDHDHPVSTDGDHRFNGSPRVRDVETAGTRQSRRDARVRGPRRAHRQADALNAGARRDARLRAAGGAASSRPPKGRGLDGPALEGGLGQAGRYGD